MKLRKFNAENSCSVRTGKPTIRIATTGYFSFSRNLVEHIGITDKSTIEILQDEEKPKDWYITIDLEGSEFPCRLFNKKNKSSSAMINSAVCAKKIFESIGISDKKSAGFIIAKEPTIVDGKKLYAIITSKPLI